MYLQYIALWSILQIPLKISPALGLHGPVTGLWAVHSHWSGTPAARGVTIIAHSRYTKRSYQPLKIHLKKFFSLLMCVRVREIVLIFALFIRSVGPIPFGLKEPASRNAGTSHLPGFSAASPPSRSASACHGRSFWTGRKCCSSCLCPSFCKSGRQKWVVKLRISQQYFRKLPN